MNRYTNMSKDEKQLEMANFIKEFFEEERRPDAIIVIAVNERDKGSITLNTSIQGSSGLAADGLLAVMDEDRDFAKVVMQVAAHYAIKDLTGGLNNEEQSTR